MVAKKTPGKKPARTTKTHKPSAAPKEKDVEISDDERRPWDRQPWDTDKSYVAFQECYLSQNPPRTVVECFRRWQEMNNLQLKRNARGSILMNPGFYNWVHARNSSGQRPAGSVYDGALTWAERAAAFDQDVYDRRLLRYRRERVALRDKEFETGNTLLDRAMAMIATMPNPNQFTEADIIKHVDVGFKLMRRALGMEERVVATKDWETALEDAGIDAQEVFNRTVEQLVEQLETEDAESPATE